MLFNVQFTVKFIYSEKATKFCEIFPLLLTVVHTVKSKGKILQNFVAFSEYMNFTVKNAFFVLKRRLEQTHSDGIFLNLQTPTIDSNEISQNRF